MKQVVSVAAIIYNDRMQVLLAMRSPTRCKGAGQWETIGGRLEFGESPIECLEREINEELGCEIVDYRLFNVYSYIQDGAQTISVVFTVRIEGTPRINSLEIQRLAWFEEYDTERLEFTMNCKQRIKDFFHRITD